MYSTVLLVFLVSFLLTHAHDHTDDDFIDIGVQLRGDGEDGLVADLIAEENDFFNAGHVSQTNENETNTCCSDSWR
jgi:hypothetical protein